MGLSLVLVLGSTACLKTRAQLRDEDDGDREMPAQVQEVQPQGQYVIDEIKSEITRLTGRVEDLERSNRKAGEGADKDQVKKLEERVIELEQAQAAMLEAIKKMEGGLVQADPSPLFEKGRSLYKADKFEEAIEALSSYMKAPKAKKVEEATYLRAESYYKTKQYQKAIVDYSKFTEKYTKSEHVPAAYYKIGLSFEAMGMKDDAKGFFQTLIDSFPKSEEAKKAKKKVK